MKATQLEDTVNKLMKSLRKITEILADISQVDNGRLTVWRFSREYKLCLRFV